MSDTIPDYDPDEVQRVAMQVTNLLQFSSLLIPDLQMLKDTYTDSANRTSHIHAIAPVIGAVGGDYEEAAFEAELRQKRAKAIVALVECLAETEIERAKFAESQRSKAAGLAQLRGLGLA